MKNRNKKLALVFGSGGARGLAHIGVIKAFKENDIPIDIVAGTSVGAFVGGVYASGMDVESMEKIALEVDKITVAKVFRPKFFGPGFVDNRRVKEFIHDLVGDVNIDYFDIPFASVATDFITGEEVIFNKGPLVDAILSSVAIPAILQPVNINGRFFLDGGLSNPLPISVAKNLGAGIIIAVNVSPNPERITKKMKNRKSEEVNMFIKRLPAAVKNLINEYTQNPDINQAGKQKDDEVDSLNSLSILSVFLQSVTISTNNIMMKQLREATPDILICPKIEDFDLLEFYRGTEIIKKGYDAAIKVLPAIKELLEAPTS